MLIKNAKVVDLRGERSADVLIEDGVIKKIGVNLRADEVIDAKGAYLLPALIDLNVRVLDDRINTTNLQALGKQALEGGVGSVALIPDSTPPIDEEISLEFVKAQTLPIKLYPLVMGTKGEGLSEISILLKKGAGGIYTTSDINPYLLARIFEYAKMHQIPLHIAPRNKIFQDVGVMNEGKTAFELGLGGIDTLEEKAEVAKVIEYSEHYEVPVLFKGVSTARSLDLIADSHYCYAEVGIHHLLLSEEVCEGYNTLAKIMPPLRSEEERQRMLLALQEGKIDLLSSLHSPKSKVAKEVSFQEAAFGIDGLEYLLPLAYTHLVRSHIIDLPKLTELLSANPACFLGEKLGKVEEGYEAQLLLFDPEGSIEAPLYGKLEGHVRGVVLGDRYERVG